MDSSLHSASLTKEDEKISLGLPHEEAEGAEEEHHIHLPNPSLWPLLLSAAILLTVLGLLFIPDSPWLVLVGVPLIIVGIMGWVLEDPNAHPHEEYVHSPALAGVMAKFHIGQEVLDKDGEWLGAVQARFGRYILVDRGGLSVKVYYVPPRFIEEQIVNNTLRLTVSEADLLKRNLDSVPADLYDEAPEFAVPQVKGVPLFAQSPLSPAETGHYNYGPNFPGVNTDAAGSYRPEEVFPAPQKYVAERRNVRGARRTLPARLAKAN